jgi:hypothetical protein
VRGVRWVACLWAASATASTIRFRVYDGATEHSVFTEQDPNADNTSTPAWACGPVRPASGRIDWTQAKVDALTFRMGSNDGNPDIGIDNIVFELAVVKAQTETLFGESASGEAYAVAHRDPDTQGLVGFTVTIPTGKSITVDYEVDGAPSSTGLLTDADSPHYEAILDGADSLPKVNRVTAY